MRISMMAATALMAIGLATPAFADPSGTYSVVGANPGGSGKYEGSVTLTKSGDTFNVKWTIGSDSFTGTAIGNDDILSVGYNAGGGKPGVALFVKQDGKWDGVWSFLGETQTGTESWSN